MRRNDCRHLRDFWPLAALSRHRSVPLPQKNLGSRRKTERRIERRFVAAVSGGNAFSDAVNGSAVAPSGPHLIPATSTPPSVPSAPSLPARSFLLKISSGI